MKLFSILAIALTIAFAALAGAGTGDSYRIAASGNDEGLNSVQDALAKVQTGSEQERLILRDQLKERLKQENNLRRVNEIALKLAPVCDDESIFILLSRLPAASRDPQALFLIQSLQHFLTSNAPLTADTRQRAADQLQTIAVDGSLESITTSAATIALATMGNEGFDRLTVLREQRRAEKLGEIYFTALAETNDPRALPLLSAAISDPTLDEGKQTQIARALGVLIRSLRERGLEVSEKDHQDAIKAVKFALTTAASNQLYESALKSLAIIDCNDALFQTAVRQALGSQIESNRDAALEALYLANTLPDPALVKYIEDMIPREQSRNLQIAAQSVLDKVHALRLQ